MKSVVSLRVGRVTLGVLLSTIYLGTAWSARAQLVTGSTVTNTDATNGLAVTIDTRWPGGHGYRPVRVEVKSLAPAIADRSLLFELRCLSLHSESGSMEVKQYIDLPAGVDRVQASIAVPEQFQVGSFECDVFEDGRFRRALSVKKGTGAGWSIGYQGWEETSPAVLVVGDQPADLTNWYELFPSFINARNWPGGVVSANPAGSPPTAMPYPAAWTLAEAQLPNRWLDYSGIDIVCLSLPQAESLAKNHSATWTALTRWTAAGGNLWVYGLGSDWQGLSQLEKLLQLPELPAGDDALKRGWTSPTKSERSSLLQGIENEQQAYAARQDVATRTVEASPPQPPQPAVEVPAAHFVSRRLSMGLIVGIADEQVFPSASINWGWIFNHVGPNRYLWARRNGFSLHGDNPDFWTWFISGVGLAPVGTFAVLISLFVVVIGPINYWWLRRRGKLHLLLVTVPMCALLVTGTLFGYGLIADGLSVRTRFRSYTEIDQPRGEAVCWSRSCYYAALSPSGGLQFPDDVLVSPYEDVSQFFDYNSRVRRSVEWGDSSQQLRSGWLPARNQTQYITVRSRASTSKLLIETVGDQPTAWNATNQLGTRVERLLVIAPDGSPWKAENLQPDAKTPLSAANLDVEIAAFRKAISDNARSSLPPEVQASELVSTRRNSRRYRYGYYNNSSDVHLWSGRLEFSLLELLLTEPRGNGQPTQDANAASTNPNQLKLIGPRMYLCLVDHSPEAAVGVPRYREEESLHVVVGHW